MPFDTVQDIHPSVSTNLSPRVINALLEIEHGLRVGRYEHVALEEEGLSQGFERHYKFNMMEWAVPTVCGTVRCIGGDLEASLRRNLTSEEYVFCRGLFFPQDLTEGPRAWLKITPAQAAEAIRNFIATGEPRWSEIVT